MLFQATIELCSFNSKHIAIKENKKEEMSLLLHEAVTNTCTLSKSEQCL